MFFTSLPMHLKLRHDVATAASGRNFTPCRAKTRHPQNVKGQKVNWSTVTFNFYATITPHVNEKIITN